MGEYKKDLLLRRREMLARKKTYVLKNGVLHTTAFKSGFSMTNVQMSLTPYETYINGDIIRPLMQNTSNKLILWGQGASPFHSPSGATLMTFNNGVLHHDSTNVYAVANHDFPIKAGTIIDKVYVKMKVLSIYTGGNKVNKLGVRLISTNANGAVIGMKIAPDINWTNNNVGDILSVSLVCRGLATYDWLELQVCDGTCEIQEIYFERW